MFDAGDAGAQVRAERRKERSVRDGIVKRLTGGANDAQGAARDEYRDGRGVTIDFFRDNPAQLGAFGGRGAHQRHLRIVLIKRAAGKFRGHAGAFAEVHHVEATGRDDGGNLGARGGVQPVGSSAEDAADEFVGPLRRRHIEHAGHEAAGDQRFHGASPGAGSGEDEDFIAGSFENFFGLGDPRGGVAKHAGHDERFFRRRSRGGATSGGGRNHAGDGTGGVFKNHPGDAVNAGDIDDGRHHHEIGGADVGRSLTARERRDHELGKSDRQCAHRSRGDRGAAATPEGNDTLNTA